MSMKWSLFFITGTSFSCGLMTLGAAALAYTGDVSRASIWCVSAALCAGIAIYESVSVLKNHKGQQ